MEPKYQIGDCVIHKINLTTMTIAQIRTQRSMIAGKVGYKGFSDEFVGTYLCRWYIGKKAHEEVFHEDSLQPC